MKTMGKIIKSGCKIIQVDHKYEVSDRLEIIILTRDRKLLDLFKQPGTFDPRHLGMAVDIEYNQLLDGTNEIISIGPSKQESSSHDQSDSSSLSSLRVQ